MREKVQGGIVEISMSQYHVVIGSSRLNPTSDQQDCRGLLFYALYSSPWRESPLGTADWCWTIGTAEMQVHVGYKLDTKLRSKHRLRNFEIAVN